jgi:hypothetical protein
MSAQGPASVIDRVPIDEAAQVTSGEVFAMSRADIGGLRHWTPSGWKLVDSRLPWDGAAPEAMYAGLDHSLANRLSIAALGAGKP